MELNSTHLIIAILSFFAGIASTIPTGKVYERKKPDTLPPTFHPTKKKQNWN